MLSVGQRGPRERLLPCRGVVLLALAQVTHTRRLTGAWRDVVASNSYLLACSPGAF